jgi:hypothetical protein
VVTPLWHSGCEQLCTCGTSWPEVMSGV